MKVKVHLVHMAHLVMIEEETILESVEEVEVEIVIEVE